MIVYGKFEVEIVEKENPDSGHSVQKYKRGREGRKEAQVHQKC